MFARLGRGDAADLDVERAVPGHHADEASRRRIARKIARVHRVDRGEMGGVDTARATMLAALMGGQSLTASELAYLARISRSTASEHLGRLVQALSWPGFSRSPASAASATTASPRRWSRPCWKPSRRLPRSRCRRVISRARRATTRCASPVPRPVLWTQV